jgi:hypothetical protein
VVLDCGTDVSLELLCTLNSVNTTPE